MTARWIRHYPDGTIVEFEVDDDWPSVALCRRLAEELRRRLEKQRKAER